MTPPIAKLTALSGLFTGQWKHFPGFMIWVILLGFSQPLLLRGQAAPAEEKPTGAPVVISDISFKHEIQHAIDRGLTWLKQNQNEEGWWSTADHPAVTALALMALRGHPEERYSSPQPPWMNQGYRYLLESVRPDGSIQRAGLATYNTALSLLALLAAENPGYEPIMRKARQFIVQFQADFNQPGIMDSPFDGGIGYGSKYDHSDMGNTLQAMEALYYSRHLGQDKDTPVEQIKEDDLDWKAAIHFLQSCQNLPSHNKEPWASDDDQNRGGFVYYPGLSKAGTVTNSTTGRVALRSYGSISYAGLLAYIYAQMDRNDPRILAVMTWLKNNYTLEENPGMGAQGLYYYFHTMAKALTIHDIQELTLADGTKVDWRRDLAMHLINLQKPNGSWLNDQHGRWWENDPALVTSYVVLTLERIYSTL